MRSAAFDAPAVFADANPMKGGMTMLDLAMLPLFQNWLIHLRQDLSLDTRDDSADADSRPVSASIMKRS